MKENQDISRAEAIRRLVKMREPFEARGVSFLEDGGNGPSVRLKPSSE